MCILTTVLGTARSQNTPKRNLLTIELLLNYIGKEEQDKMIATRWNKGSMKKKQTIFKNLRPKKKNLKQYLALIKD